MENIIISCRTIQTEVNDAIHRNQVKDPVVYLESGLHNDPALLREELQKVLDRLGNVHRVLLVMGF
ncbi:MAG TPA: hypothetical protein DHN33_07785, partial [Eubacteriaceae bacterium]|nr:hypothetical protein [Eubacteriaceae bacterium]